jgi:DNA replication protein DnaC
MPADDPRPRRGLADTATLLDRFARARDTTPDPDHNPDAPPTPDETIAQNRATAQRCLHLWTPPLFRNAHADHPEVIRWARAYIADRAACGSLLLLGNAGTGKTHQAYGALRLIAESGRPPIGWRGTSAVDLYAELRPRDGIDSHEVFTRYADLDLLLLDDVGAAKDTQFTEDVTYRLVNHRYEQNLPMILTTNLRVDDLRKAIGDRTASRLAAMCTQVELRGTDRRRAK